MLFLLYNNVNQPYVYVSPLSRASLSPPPRSTPLGHHGAPCEASCAVQQLPTSCFTHCSVYMGEGKGSPLQCSCLEYPRVGHDWSDLAAATVYICQRYFPNLSHPCRPPLYPRVHSLQNPRLVLVKRLGAKVSSGLEYLNADSSPSTPAHPCEDRPRSTVKRWQP